MRDLQELVEFKSTACTIKMRQDQDTNPLIQKQVKGESECTQGRMKIIYGRSSSSGDRKASRIL